MSRRIRLGHKVLLVNPNRMQPPVAPIALGYLASALGLNGYEVDLLDLCFSEDVAADIEGYFARNSVVAVAFTIRNTDDASFATRAFFIPEYKGVIDCLRRHTDAPIILGGSGFSIMPQAILGYCGLDMGIWGEGEYALPLLVDRIVNGGDCWDVPGLVYRAGRDFETNPPKYLDLASMATPRRDMVDNRRYFEQGGMGNIETKRGCAGRCIYCADPLGKGNRVRLRSPQSIADEVEVLLEMGIDHFHFCDSEFNLPPGHAMSVCHELVSRGLGSKVRWYAYCSPLPFDDDIASAFQRAGCAGINFGVDSAEDRMLRTLGRSFSVEDLERMAQVCHRQGITFMYDLLLGGPGETRESLKNTVETMKRLSPSRVGAALGVRVYPGTGMADIVRNQGPIEMNTNLHGVVDETLFAPIFYLEAALGNDAPQHLADLIAGDERFFFMSGDTVDRNYNYNDNDLLVNAIRGGYRGAFWDILRRLADGPSLDSRDIAV
jgi:radical SAM superfamily enzyme YgiQ (UPF0313 family)